MSKKTESLAVEWFPQRYISGEDPFVLMLLNQPLNDAQQLFVKSTWRSAVFRVAVDGGANELKEAFGNNTEFIPDLVSGDFDSATPEVIDFYRQKGVRIVCTPDQDETDFTKALRLTVEHLGAKKVEASSIIVVSRNGDRLDHMIGNLNTLFLAREFTSLPILIYGNNSITWLLSVGCHKIHVSETMMDSHIGLFPLGSECNDVSTTGLKWNLSHDKMNFGGLISTCNKFDGSDTVTVATDTPLIWTMELKMTS